MWSQPQASSGTFSTRTIDVGFTEDSLQGEAGALAVNKASTVSDKKADQHCGRYHNRSLNICEGLVVRPDLDPVPSLKTTVQARAKRRQGVGEEHQQEATDSPRRRRGAYENECQEAVPPGEATHFRRVEEAMKKRIGKLSEEGRPQFMRRMSRRHRQELPGIRRSLIMKELCQAMRTGLERPNPYATCS